MESLIILIPIAVMLIALAVRIFLWAVDNDQFDDLEGPAHSILFDDDNPVESRAMRNNQATPATKTAAVEIPTSDKKQI
ncbi:cbb3-type cytochrome oxidase assembly protein CcoS [Endozoicomonas arenosclerae]|uniref:cbb3-type cytochrome oxidase assembly protein CcoS n=1 Tax=Endozoicomonas arenosclerae TaxID=1633495 RepID=UPI000786374E|nr:cbb3-type cytochrome oxidase assembly protein CcoS [Endozoicomonas arenosclerae]